MKNSFNDNINWIQTDSFTRPEYVSYKTNILSEENNRNAKMKILNKKITPFTCVLVYWTWVKLFDESIEILHTHKNQPL